MTSPLTPAAAKVMQNDLIFPLIAKNLPAEALFALRPTCKSWSTIFLPHIKAKHSEIHLDALSRSWQNDPAIKSQLQNFNEVMMRSSRSGMGNPFEKYLIRDLTIVEHGKAVEEFFAVCGQSITSLSLESLVDGNEDLVNVKVNVDKIREVVFRLVPNLAALSIAAYEDHDRYSTPDRLPSLRLAKELPKLRSLKFYMIGSLERRYQDLLADLLRSAVGLEHLEVGQLDYDPGITVTACERLRDSLLHPDKLKTLKLFSVEIRELQILLELAYREQNPLRLETFSSSIVYLDEELNAGVAQLLHSFMVTQAPTLRSLKLGVSGRPHFWCDDDRTSSTSVIHIPRREALSYFSFSRRGWKNFRVQFGEGPEGAGTMAANFPSLKRFKYAAHADRESCPPLMSEAEVAAIQTAEVTTLFHDGVSELALCVVIDSGIFPQLASALPSITRLECDLSCHFETNFPALWTMWPALTIFHVRYSTYMETNLDLDSILSGMPSSSLARLKSSGESWSLEGAREQCRMHKTGPGLADLLHLKEFVLNIDGRINLTDVGGYFGLAMANPGLQHMAVWVHDTFGVSSREKRPILSEKCMEVIRSAFSVGAVIEL